MPLAVPPALPSSNEQPQTAKQEQLSDNVESWEESLLVRGCTGEEDKEIDENDPLWKATLKITKGNRVRAIELLQDPDELMQFPEVKAVMNEKPQLDVDEWDTTADFEKTNKDETDVIEKLRGDKQAASSPCVVVADDSIEHFQVPQPLQVEDETEAVGGSVREEQEEDPHHVDKRTIEKYEREAKQRNRESWFLAFIMDTNEEERAKGKTVEVGRAPFATAAKRYTILDAPGHKNYVPHMISGAAQADVGILVISARRGEFETGFERGGQTHTWWLL
ncbi:hypothetical protein CTAYLR_008196 [Chrysophaeum taylorii]|uniref:Tr-type G domain-containing protein n=1 Tax=Chrysophaeum taylorii TaxID=2483200 RepID=A0AAD7UEG5_9STRA|nr:hypothetical protein CTAYLR_008196 [Chrysophaeum taylorii]